MLDRFLIDFGIDFWSMFDRFLVDVRSLFGRLFFDLVAQARWRVRSFFGSILGALRVTGRVFLPTLLKRSLEPSPTLPQGVKLQDTHTHGVKLQCTHDFKWFKAGSISWEMLFFHDRGTTTSTSTNKPDYMPNWNNY